MFDYDAELVRHNAVLRAAAAVTANDRVLDIGCGTGQATREAGHAARAGSALGVDVSSAMLQRARHLTDAADIDNVIFEQADAQTHSFTPQTFTLAISRFGTMFFADPVAAFANIGSALQPGARLMQLVWQAADRQEWVSAIRDALTVGRVSPTAPTGGAFSLADPAVMSGVLTAAGFTALEITEVCEPVYYGADAGRARAALDELGMVDHLVADLHPSGVEQAQRRLMSLLDAHDNGEGVWFDSAAWLVTARRAP